MNKPCNIHIPDSELPVRHQLVQMFWILGPAFARWAEANMQHETLTSQRLRLLALLKETGPMRMVQLRDELGVTATNITALVTALEKEGMVTRCPDPNDRRAIMVSITPETAQMLTDNCEAFRERVSKLFSTLSEDEQYQLLTHLQQVKESLVTHNILKDAAPTPAKTPTAA